MPSGEDTDIADLPITGPTKICDLNEALELTGFGKFHIMVILVSGLVIVCVVTQLMGQMFITPMSACDLNLTLTGKGFLQSSSFIGVVLGAHMWGYFLDTRGRRITMIRCLTINGTVNTLSAFVHIDWLFIIARIFAGFCLAAGNSGAMSYTGEFFDNKRRPTAIATVSIFIGLAFIYLPSVCFIVSLFDFSYDLYICEFKPWRMFVLINSIPNVIAITGLYFLPETPKYLIAHDRPNKALKVLRHVYAINNKDAPENYPPTKITFQGFDTGYREDFGFFYSMWVQTKALLKPPILQRFILMSLLNFCLLFFAAGLMLWYPHILIQLHTFAEEHPDETLTLCKATINKVDDIRHSHKNEDSECISKIDPRVIDIVIIVNTAYACVFIFVAFTISYLGKKNMLYVFICLTTVSGIIAQSTNGLNTVQFAMGAFLMGNVNVSLILALAVDLFPTSIRGMGVSMSVMIGRIGAVLGANTIGHILNSSFWCYYLYYIAVVDNFIMILTIMFLPGPIAG